MCKAFTLIELLVVVTIIVVLLALLAPALDKAIYQAELAVCGARLKSMAMAVTSYAAAERRWYPYRIVIHRNAGQPTRISSSIGNASPTGQLTNDDRQMLRGYMGFENYLDPFLPSVEIENSDPDTNIFAQYSMWFAYRFRTANHKGMMKIGDRIEWQSVTDTTEPIYRFDLLASDPDHLRSGNNYAFTSHPDADGILAPETLQDTDPTTPQLGQFAALKLTLAWWLRDGVTPARGALDLNYAYQDGGVRRLNSVGWNEWEERERIVRIPESSNRENEHPDWHQLPKP